MIQVPPTTPSTDPTPIFDMVRGNFRTELLVAAVSHFDLFSRLARSPMTLDALRAELDLAERPAVVLIVALRAMGLLEAHADGRLDLTPVAREHLVRNSPYYMGDYAGLVADSAGVKATIERLKTNKPVGEKTDDEGAEGSAFTFRRGVESAMDVEASARKLTLALSGRAKIVAPALASNYPLGNARVLLDVGGGTGIYSLSLLRANPKLRAIVWDRAEVLKVAREFAESAGLLDRVELRPGDMFTDPAPQGSDVVLLSNILHDWDWPECHALIGRCAAVLSAGGKMLIHDVFLNDTMDGPLPVALYSAALFSVTEGRAYSAAEYRTMLTAAGLDPGDVVPTLVHCGVLPGTKR